jgi:hypothetical protein
VTLELTTLCRDLRRFDVLLRHPDSHAASGGTVTSLNGMNFAMTVWNRHNSGYPYNCTLTNMTHVSGPNNTVDVSCTSPDNRAMVTSAVVAISHVQN